MKWFSTKLRFVPLVEGLGGVRYMDSVFLFRCKYDWDIAFQQALKIGRGEEKTYTNTDGKTVVWKLVNVISLDVVEKLSANGTEVYSEPVWLSDNAVINLDASFEPEKSEPTQTI